MQRFYDFFRRHPTGVDTFWAVILFAVSAHGVMARIPSSGLERPLGLFVAFALSLAVALRRRKPERMLLLTFAVGIGQLAADIRMSPADFAILVIIYTVASIGARWA